MKQNLSAEYVGKKFGRLLVTLIKAERRLKDKKIICKAICDCGTEISVPLKQLKDGGTKSCGCIKRETLERIHREKLFVKNRSKRDQIDSSVNAIICHYKQKNKKSKKLWLLDKETAQSLFESNCFYCDDPPSNTHTSSNGFKYKYNGIDRTDNKKDYSHDNVRPSCRKCNFAKNNMGENEFLEWIVKVASNYANMQLIAVDKQSFIENQADLVIN